MTLAFVVSLAVVDVGQRIGQFIVNILAVAGAGLIGYLLTATTLWLVVRVALRRRLPKQVTKLTSITGGIALALLIAWMAFFGTGGGFGWGGLGFGGGSDGGLGAGSLTEAVDTEPQVAPKPQPGPAQSEKNADSPAAPPLSILLLGGDRVRGDSEDDLTFYQILPDGAAMGFRQIKGALRQRKSDQPPLREIILIIRHDSVAQNHPAVRRIEEWAKDEGLTVSRRVSD